jgi:branched-chain amino acid transport system ATP-binding protein
MASRVYLLETGRIVASGTAHEIGSDDSIRKAYLGF